VKVISVFCRNVVWRGEDIIFPFSYIFEVWLVHMCNLSFEFLCNKDNIISVLPDNDDVNHSQLTTKPLHLPFLPL